MWRLQAHASLRVALWLHPTSTPGHHLQSHFQTLPLGLSELVGTCQDTSVPYCS